MVVVADRDAGAGAEIVVDVLFETPDRPGVRVALHVPPDPVEAIAEAVRSKLVLRVEQQPRGFRRRS